MDRGYIEADKVEWIDATVENPMLRTLAIYGTYAPNPFPLRSLVISGFTNHRINVLIPCP